MSAAYLFLLVVTAATWLAPARGHRSGWLTVYGNQQLSESNAAFHGYDLSLSPTRCGLASVSPSMLGQIIWVRPAGGEWVMCYAVDTVARVHWHQYVTRGYVADVPRWLVQRWGSDYGVEGELFMGACPPGEHSAARPFEPVYALDHERPVRAYSGWPYPAQQIPVDCEPPRPIGWMRPQ